MGLFVNLVVYFIVKHTKIDPFFSIHFSEYIYIERGMLILYFICYMFLIKCLVHDTDVHTQSLPKQGNQEFVFQLIIDWYFLSMDSKLCL